MLKVQKLQKETYMDKILVMCLPIHLSSSEISWPLKYACTNARLPRSIMKSTISRSYGSWLLPRSCLYGVSLIVLLHFLAGKASAKSTLPTCHRIRCSTKVLPTEKLMNEHRVTPEPPQDVKQLGIRSTRSWWVMGNKVEEELGPSCKRARRRKTLLTTDNFRSQDQKSPNEGTVNVSPSSERESLNVKTQFWSGKAYQPVDPTPILTPAGPRGRTPYVGSHSHPPDPCN